MKYNRKTTFILAALLLTALTIALVFKANDQLPASGLAVNDGKMLAAKFCQSCHQLPDPGLLDKERWQSMVLPIMGLYLGTTPHNGIAINEVEKGLFSAQPLMTNDQWQQIVDYYVGAAPQILPAQKARGEVVNELPFFSIHLPHDTTLYSRSAITSYIKIDTSVKPHRILVTNSITNELYVLNKELEIQHRYKSGGPIVDLCFQKDEILACTIGKEIVANDVKQGFISSLEINKTSVTEGKVMFNNLARPVQVQEADLDNDGKKDYLISQFGNLTGELSWIKNDGTNDYKTYTISKLPGALRSIIDDYNKDGLPDIWAQFSQGEEGIFLFTNKGNGEFERGEVLQFPPSYGSTSFDLIDINKDGYKDIIYTCGDNGDYSRVLKPYHGLYIYLNNGKNGYTEKVFFPINGCYKAIAKDFDNDGDIDIATISYFPSTETPWEAFIYLENKGGLSFKAHTMPLNIPFQKGVTIDAGDLDGDGRIDIIIGNGYFTSRTSIKQPLFVVLKNKTNDIGK